MSCHVARVILPERRVRTTGARGVRGRVLGVVEGCSSGQAARRCVSPPTQPACSQGGSMIGWSSCGSSAGIHSSSFGRSTRMPSSLSASGFRWSRRLPGRVRRRLVQCSEPPTFFQTTGSFSTSRGTLIGWLPESSMVPCFWSTFDSLEPTRSTIGSMPTRFEVT